jgi:hypothetical protein
MMEQAVRPFTGTFITPMAAVAGAVADDILAVMTQGTRLQKAYVNNGGDIAIHLGEGEVFDLGLMANPASLELIGSVQLRADMGMGGIATRGRLGRSHSLGIADAVTVLAHTAAQADAAATVLANTVDLPDHPAILRQPACTLQPDSDLGDRPVTVDVGQLAAHEKALALDHGLSLAESLREQGLLSAAVLSLQGEVRVCKERTPSVKPAQVERIDTTGRLDYACA